MESKPVNDRICYIRLRTRCDNLSILNVYSPEDSKETEKDEFYERLTQIYESLPQYDVKIMLGDLNAQIGREEINEATIGKHSLHQ